MRKAKIRVTYYDSNNVSSAIGQFEFEVSQQSAIKISDDLYLERYEEARMTLQPSIIYSLQGGNAAEMQWGYSAQVLYGNSDRYTNGNYLTANAVYKHVQTRIGMNAPAWTTPTYDEYREKYPLTGEKITEPATGLETESVYYYPMLATKITPTLFFDPIYNSSTARYCHEKNRDANGNGIIDVDETVWYLPSLADMIYIRANLPSGTHIAGTYWTSSEEDVNNSWTYDLGTGASKSVAKTTRNNVRCVKGKGVASLPAPALYSSGNDNSKIDFKYSGGYHYIYITDKTALPWTVTSSNTSWLKFRQNIGGGEIYESLTGYGNSADRVVYALSNPSSTTRTATIILTRRDTPKTEIITVTQVGAPPVATVDKTTIELDFLDEEPVSFSVDNKGTGLQWTVTSNQSWLELVQNPIGGARVPSFSATGNETLNVVANSTNPSSSARTGTLTLSRAQMPNITITITQKPTPVPYLPARHKGWAGSNIRWNSFANCLAFDDVGVTTTENYQGLVFYWGSLVALSPAYPYDASTAIVFAPKTVANPNAIPKAEPFANLDRNRHSVLEVHDPKNNIGDICRYMTKMGLAPGAKQGKKWRLPTSEECKDFEIGSTPPADWNRYPNSNSTTTRYGQAEIPNGRLKNSYGSLPANGWFEMPNGTSGSTYGWWVGHAGSYWTGTPYMLTESAMLYFDGSASVPGFVIGRNLTHLAGVRCVLE